MNTLNRYNDEQINQTTTLLKNIFSGDPLGIYVYGSFILGGLQRFSDIDILVVSKRPTTESEKQLLIDELKKISGAYRSIERRPLELTIVVEHHIKPRKFPPKFDFKYGDWLKSKFEHGNLTPWETTISPDLAIVLTQVLLASKVIYGQSPKNVLAPIPYQDFIQAMTSGVGSLMEDLEWDTR